MTRAPGQIIGTAGGSLQDSTGWAANKQTADAGARGELATARVLDKLTRAPGGPTVLHDLRIPIPGISANIDHIVVSGRQVTIIDSKTWKPGFYWTLAGMTFRGRERFAPADKKTMKMAYEAITGHLNRTTGARAHVQQPLLVVWPSTARAALQLLLLRSPGARATTGATFTAKAIPMLSRGAADPAIVAALRQLVIGKSR